jgi:hypothetical protein
MKMKLILFAIIIAFASNTSSAQDKSYVSNKHTITKANGESANGTNDKTLYFDIRVYSSSTEPNKLGKIFITNQPFTKFNEITYKDEFKIYSIKLNNSGIYDYWTIDVANDGQTVLFEINQNSAVPTITVSRYQPGQASKVLKTVIYYLE